MMLLLSLGYVGDVMAYWLCCATNKTVDNSLVRYFVTELLLMVEAPYSSDFITWTLSIIDAGVSALAMTPSCRGLVADFLELCIGSDNPTAARLLPSLQTRFAVD